MGTACIRPGSWTRRKAAGQRQQADGASAGCRRSQPDEADYFRTRQMQPSEREMIIAHSQRVMQSNLVDPD